MNEERERILNMLAEEKISVDQAEKLLRALASDQSAPSTGADRPAAAIIPAAMPRPKGKAKYLRVVVEGEGNRVNVRVPLALIRAGMRLSSLIPQPAIEQVDKALSDQGIQFSLHNLDPKHLDEIVDAFADLAVDVDADDGTKVRIFCE